LRRKLALRNTEYFESIDPCLHRRITDGTAYGSCGVLMATAICQTGNPSSSPGTEIRVEHYLAVNGVVSISLESDIEAP
jgi:hypothetical protein